MAKNVKSKNNGKKTDATSVQTRHERLKGMLITKRKSLLEQSRAGFHKMVNGHHRKGFGAGMEDGDVSASVAIEDVSIIHINRAYGGVANIDNALQRLNEGTYGICDECGEEINEKRLNAMPFAVLCVDCQTERELQDLHQ